MDEPNLSKERLLTDQDKEESDRQSSQRGGGHQHGGLLERKMTRKPKLSSEDDEESEEGDESQENLAEHQEGEDEEIHGEEQEEKGNHEEEQEEEEENKKIAAMQSKKDALLNQKKFVEVDENNDNILFSDDKIPESAPKARPNLLLALGSFIEQQRLSITAPAKPKKEATLVLIPKEKEVEVKGTKKEENASQQQKVKEAMKKRKIVRYIAYFTYIAMIILGLLAFFKYSLIRSTFYFYNTSNLNTTLKLAIDNCSLYIMDPEDPTVTAPIYVQYFMPPGHESGSASIGGQLVTEDSLTVNILNAGDPYYCLGKLFIRADVTPLDSLEITCGKCNITQETSSQLQITGLLNLTGDSLHANFRNVKVGSVSYQSFTGHLQFNNIDSDNGVNNIVMGGEGDIIIQSMQDYVVNATTNTQAFCFGGTSLTSRDNGTCTYSDQNVPTPSEYQSCNLSWSVCLSDDCNPISYPTYVVNSTNGNVYANAISKIGTPVIPKQVVSGQIYNNGIAFSATAEEVLESFDQYVADPDKSNPFVVLNLGDIASRSSKYAKWIVSSVPSYALMKPWWIGTFSGSMLDGYVKGANGILLPGFCPFYPDYTNPDLLTMQNLIFSKITTPQTLVTFVVDESMPAPTDKHQKYTGVFPLIGGGNPSDRWFSLGLSAGGNIILQNNDYTKKGEILAAIFVSLSIATYATYLALTLTGISINTVYVKLVDFSSHLSNYSKLEKSKAKEKQEGQEEPEAPKQSKTERKIEMKLLAGLGSKNSMIDFFKHAPSPLAFIDYLSLIFLRQFSNSVVQFYFLLFREQIQGDDQELDPNQNMIKGTEVKALYEKFCFMNHLNEQKLTDPINQAVLKKYGFEIAVREDLRSEVFTRLTLKKKTPFLVNTKLLKKQSSLECYMNENVKITQFEEDQIEVKEFIRSYNDFCSYNRLPRVQISPSLMKEKYGISVNFVPQQYILRIQDQSKEEDLEDDFIPLKFAKKGMAKIQSYVPTVKHTKRFIIDKSKIENHFKLVMEETNSMTNTQLEEATTDLILYPGWPLWDAFTVLLHLLLSALITAPLIYFVVLNESQYQPWSLKDNQYLIRYNDFFHDPLQFSKNLYDSFTWNVALMIVATSLWIVSSFDLMLYYAIMEFPQDKSFKRAQIQVEENIVERVSRQAEWMFVFMALIIYFLYISLILIWLLLGAFINPYTFLPFASAAVTFVVFVISKFNAFKEVSQQGTKKIKAFVKKLFGSFTNNVLGKITKSFEKSGRLQIVNPNDPNKPKVLAEGIPQTEGAQTEYEAIPTEQLVEGKKEIQSVTSIKAIDANDLKLKKVKRVKDECAKRNIPTHLTDLMLSIFLQDRSKKRQNFQAVIQALNTAKKLQKGGADIITELLFPQGINNQEIVLFINIQLLRHLFKEPRMSGITDLTPETLYEMFMMFKQLENHQYDAFIQKFKQKLCNHGKFPHDEFDFFVPILDIAAILSKDKPDHWNIKHSCFKLFRIAEYLHSKGSKEEAEECRNTLEKFVKFLPLMFSVYEVPYYIDDPKRLMDSKESLNVIENFCDTIGTSKKSQEMKVSEEEKNPISIPDVIYLGISMIKHEAGDLPRRVTRAIEEPFEAEIPSNRFFPFCLNLTNVLYNKPDSFYQRLTRNAATFGVSSDLQNFVKIITCFHMRGFETHFSDTTIEKNYYFMKIAEQMKAKPKELLGIIDLIFGKRNSKFINFFFQALLTRMDLKWDLIEILKSVVHILSSRDEGMLLQAIKTLELDYIPLLLVGKHILNPKFLPSDLFEHVGIIEGLTQKDTIFDAPRDQFSNWKASIRGELTTNINKYRDLFNDKNKPKDKTFKSPEEFSATANLVKFYFSDWKNFTYSKKNIMTAITALSNPKNKLKSKLMNIEQGKDFNGVDYIARVMVISALQLENGRKFNRLDKEKENAIMALADYLGFNPELFGNFLKIFILNDKEAVMKSFFSFFEEEEENETEISKILGFGFTQVAGIQKQLDFINDDLPNSIDFFGKKSVKVPANLIKKIYFGSSYGDLDMNDIHELISMKIHSLKLDEEDEKKIQANCVDISLLSKGVLDFDPKSPHCITNKKIADLIKIFSEVNIDSKYFSITKMFARYDDKTDHPIKVAVALSGLLTYGKFPIQGCFKKVFDPKKPMYYAYDDTPHSIPAYLGYVFDIHPEFFDLFYIVFERDVSRFFQKSLPLIRRLSRSPILDTNLLESLFSLFVGEKFNTYNLSEKLGISPDIIEFFVSLVRISNQSKRRKELDIVGESIAVGQILSKLKIRTEEFLNLLKLVFNEFEITEEAIGEILRNVGLRPEEGESDVVQVDFLKGLIAISAPTDPKVNFLKNKKDLSQLQARTTTFWNFVELVDYKQDAFIIARLAAGNFLVLEEFKDYLGWIFPTHDDKSERAILNMTMGLFGLIHSNLEINAELNADVEGFVKEFYAKGVSFEEFEYKIGSAILPNNSLAYAIYLTYQTLDLPPKLIQAFLYDQKAIKSMSTQIPNLNEEFLVGLVLQFKGLNDVVGDLFGLYDWTYYCQDFYKTTRGPKMALRPKVEDFIKNIDQVYGFFYDKMRFEIQSLEQMAGLEGILNFSNFRKIFNDKVVFNNKINQTFFYLLTKNKSKKDKVELAETLRESFGSKLVVFLEEFANRTNQNQGDKKVFVGKLIREAIMIAYQTIHQKMYENEPRYLGFAITDLCLIADLTSLRSSSSYSFQRKLHCLHQIMINIERKMIFDDNFYRMSKFKIMKILGIALNMRISNIVEWCLIPSFFNNAYVSKLHQASSEEEKLAIKKEKCELLLCKATDSLKEEEKDSITILIGDLGYFGGGYKTFTQKMGQILDSDSWEKINIALEFDSVYFVHTQDENVVTFLDQLKDNERLIFEHCKPEKGESQESAKLEKEEVPGRPEKQEEEISYKSRELIEIVFAKNSPSGIPQIRTQNVDDIEDPKTGLLYKELIEKSTQFERTLMNDNMALIVGISRGDPTEMVEGNHILNKQDPTMETTKLYMAILGLQSYTKREKRSRLMLTSYLRSLSSHLESDVIALDELLNFLITRKRKDYQKIVLLMILAKFSQVTNILDVSDHILALLLISIEAAEKDGENDDDDPE